MTDVPSAWQFALLTLAAFRCIRLIGWDEITDPWRKRMVKGNRRRNKYAMKLLTCAWCIGFWVSLAWWAAWLVFPNGTLIAATPWAIAAATGLIAKRWDP